MKKQVLDTKAKIANFLNFRVNVIEKFGFDGFQKFTDKKNGGAKRRKPSKIQSLNNQLIDGSRR